jgi:hypothetical protein
MPLTNFGLRLPAADSPKAPRNTVCSGTATDAALPRAAGSRHVHPQNENPEYTGESYFTHRLVASERAGTQVRQITLRNLGRHFDLPHADWPRLCVRIRALLVGQGGLPAETETIETLAQRYAAQPDRHPADPRSSG